MRRCHEQCKMTNLGDIYKIMYICKYNHFCTLICHLILSKYPIQTIIYIYKPLQKIRLLSANKIIANSLKIVTKRFSDNILVATRPSL